MPRVDFSDLPDHGRLWVFPALLVGISVLVLLAVAYWQWTVING